MRTRVALLLAVATGLASAGLTASSAAPNDQVNLKLQRLLDLDGGVHAVPPEEAALLRRIERFRCRTSGAPSPSLDISCNTRRLNQHFGPDNEIAIAVDPEDPDHLLAGSNDYFYRFNNRTGERLANTPTGFFTSFDGGRTWLDGQIPFGRNNQAGDPAPAFDAKHDVALMASLDFLRDPVGGVAANGHVTVSRSTDGGRHWSEPVQVMRGRGADTSETQVFWDKEWLAVDNNPDSPYYGRAYLTATRFFGGPVYRESPIYLSYSDDGGRTWTRPKVISGSHPTCTFQSSGGGTECDEDQYSIPEVASDGTVYVHFINAQNESEWEVGLDFDSTLMVVTSHNGGRSFSDPVPAVQLEDGLSDMPYQFLGRQTIWGHQFRWVPYGNISVDPDDPDELVIVFADRGRPNPRATEECFFTLPGEPPRYDPCRAGPGLDTDVYMVSSHNGARSWSARTTIDGSAGSAWFPWADHGPDGTLAVGYDEDLERAPADHFNHYLWVEGGGSEALLPDTSDRNREATENPDISVTHWAGQYVPRPEWPRICGPEGYRDPPVANAEGKDCNVFLGDYTGLAWGSDGSLNVVWTGLNRWATSPQLDIYTGRRHDGYVQDAMFFRQ
ncbi:MAG TPA: sialidase family protein [Actinomycetota bacterium]|nr:sialidase family protein [Actinomycetota bacterium]